MKRKRFLLPLMLAVSLLLGMAAPAGAAAPEPVLACEANGNSSAVLLRLEGLPEGGVYGVQLELALKGKYEHCVFVPNTGSEGSYSPDCVVEPVSQEETRVTIYLTDQRPLNEGGVLHLGILNLSSSAPASREALPSQAQLKLLDRGLAVSLDGTIPVEVDWQGGGEEKPGPGEGDDKPGPGEGDDKPGPGEGDDKPDPGEDGDRPGPGPGNAGNKPGDNSSDGSKPEQPPQTDDGTPPVDPSPDHGQVLLPFTDVKEGDWFYEAVQYVYAHGMMNGATESGFAPQATTTRGMIVTILHRLEGAPSASGSKFTDVPADRYYAGAVAWAASKEIVTGYGDGTFQPNAAITRQQLAAILYRYAQFKGIDVSKRADLSQFSDAGRVAGYAGDAMAWAVEAGLIGGTDGARLDPAGNASRAQVAAILMRLCQNVLGIL